MSDDIRRDAELLLAAPDKMRPPTIRRVAAAYLAEHPGDDGLPVTHSWLIETGWELEDPRPEWRRWKKVLCVQSHGFGDGATTHWLTIHEPCVGVDGSVWWAINFWQKHESDDKPDGVTLLSWVNNTTRGHVRRLLNGLGVAG